MVKEQDKENYFESVEAAAGFVNFKLSKEVLLNNLNFIIEQGELYGCSIGGQGKTIIMEIFQNNVAKPPHVAHLRSAAIGDCLVRIFSPKAIRQLPTPTLATGAYSSLAF